MRGRFRHFDPGDCMPELSLRLEARPHATRDAFHRAIGAISKCLALTAMAAAAVTSLAGAAGAQTFDSPTLALKTDWHIQSSARVFNGGGSAISQAGFSAPDWDPATVPTTVVAALVDDKIYPDP